MISFTHVAMETFICVVKGDNILHHQFSTNLRLALQVMRFPWRHLVACDVKMQNENLITPCTHHIPVIKRA